MRRRKGVFVHWKVTITAETAAAVEGHIYSESFGKPIYGARSRIIESLLIEWLKRKDAQQRSMSR